MDFVVTLCGIDILSSNERREYIVVIHVAVGSREKGVTWRIFYSSLSKYPSK